MCMDAIEAGRTGSTAKARIEIAANGPIIAGLIDRTLVHVVAGGAIDFVASWTGDALEVGREA